MLQRLHDWAQAIKRDVLAVCIAAGDRRVPWYAKATGAGVAAYALSPIDLIPDLFPGIGYLDDLIVVPLGILLVFRLIPAELMHEFRTQALQAETRLRHYARAGGIGPLWAVAADSDFRDWVCGIGITLWTIFNVVVLYLVWRNPAAHSVVPVYRNAALGWWRGADIFGPGEHGFIYLPVFAVLYTPFAMMGASFGDALWRLVSVILLSYALWRSLSLHLSGGRTADRFRAFGTLLLLMLPIGSGALRDGQATTPMLALLLLSSVAIAEERWWRAAALLAFSLAIKPLAVVFLLLAGVLYPPLISRLLLCLVPVFLLPFVNPDLLTVWHLHRLAAVKLMVAGHPGPGTWSDITGLLGALGLVLPDIALSIMRILGAVATLGVGFLALKHQNRAGASLALLTLSICYLMLMSPRTEGQTYIMLGAAVGLYAVILWHGENRRGVAWTLAALCMALGNGGYGDLIFRATELWWKPLMCLLFLPFILNQVGIGRSGSDLR